MKTTFVITLAVITQAVANTPLSKGMKVIASMPSFSDGFSLIMLAYALKSPLIWGGIFLDEPVSPAHWFGSVLIVLGVFLVSLSGARKDKTRGPLPKSGEPGPGGVAC